MIKDVKRTEKAMDLAEQQNVLTLVVDLKATKPEIKSYVEKTFNVKVASVRTLINFKGEKIAYVKLAKEHNAQEILDNLTE
ncbi:MAG: 50S ribosomal protein L23 [Candidatus Micrarchaeota archaeon]|nr:50S ribosomal protein L23 [Candidatus Micrarchaeota archaeon]